jgi:DUF917 family protein
MAGGFIASCRNPVSAAYVRRHAALGGISMALSLGERILAARPKGGAAVIEAICEETRGAIIARGRVTRKAVAYTKEAFDVGVIHVGEGAATRILHVMNEYMAVTDPSGARHASFPDVIATLDAQGAPVSVGHVREGMELAVLRVAKDELPLSSSVTDPGVYPIVEKALGMNFADYALGRVS